MSLSPIVLWFGLQTPEGRPLSFYVKKVNPDTLGWKAGIEAGDRIVQVSKCVCIIDSSRMWRVTVASRGGVSIIGQVPCVYLRVV